MKSAIGGIIGIAIAIFLFIDAPKHNKSRWLWAILGFIFGPLTLGIYLVRTGRKVLGWIVIILSIVYYMFIILLVVVLIFALLGGGFS